MSDITKDGGPAFPSDAWDSCAEPGCVAGPMRGMSLRDWFAGQALSGINWKGYERLDDSAQTCYALADFMIAQREKKS